MYLSWETIDRFVAISFAVLLCAAELCGYLYWIGERAVRLYSLLRRKYFLTHPHAWDALTGRYKPEL